MLDGLEQPRNLSIVVHIDAECGRFLRQARHGHDGSGEGYDKACAGVDEDIADADVEALRAAQFGLVVREGVLGFCHADRQIAEAQVGELIKHLLGSRVEVDSVGAVDFSGDGVDLLF